MKKTDKTIKPIFLFSLPRSGSTLLQRILGAHNEVDTLSEPWILLPYIYSLKQEGLYAEYHQWNAQIGLNEFCSHLPNKTGDYYEALHDFTITLYSKVSKKKYFLDKTPRYALVAPEIIEMFPDGKFIFLWRNPLSVVASIIQTWGKGKWNLHNFNIDLFKGLEIMLGSYLAHKDKVLSVGYEKFLCDPRKELARITDYLELKPDEGVFKRFADVNLHGTLGDPTGRFDYKEISSETLSKWECQFRNCLRKRWMKKYLAWIGGDRLELMGYSLEKLCDEVDRIPSTREKVVSDAVQMLCGKVISLSDPFILKRKLLKFPDFKNINLNG